MTAFQNTVTIARPADEVFAFLADFGNIPAWNYAIARTVQTSPGPARVGATYRQTRTVPRRSEEGFQVTKFAPPRRLAIKGQIGPFNATSSYLLEPAAGGTLLTNDVELEPSSALLRPFGPLATPRVKEAVARNLGTLKQLLEGTCPAAEEDQQ
jgi:Polyketide cyclase / dehydrase and lipid transport